jgi:hypothetical protein
MLNRRLFLKALAGVTATVTAACSVFAKAGAPSKRDERRGWQCVEFVDSGGFATAMIKGRLPVNEPRPQPRPGFLRLGEAYELSADERFVSFIFLDIETRKVVERKV